MKLYIKYVLGAVIALFIISFLGVNPTFAIEVSPIQPAETISYQEPVGVNSSLSATLPSYFFQGMHVGTLDGSGGVLFANGTIINVTRTVKDNKPIPITMGDDLRVDGEIWRGPKKGILDGMPLKISDTMVPTMNDINDLGDSMRKWKDLYLSGTVFGNNAVFSGDIDFTDANIIGLNISDGTDPDGTGSESIDADTLDGIDSTGFALNPHNHDSKYLQLTGGILTGLTSVDATLKVKSDGYAAGGVSITPDGDIMAAGDLTLDGNISVGGGFNFNTLQIGGGQGDSGVTIDQDGNILTDGKIELGGGNSAGGLTIQSDGDLFTEANVVFGNNTNVENWGKFQIPIESANPATCNQGEIILNYNNNKLCVCATSNNWSCLSL